MSNRQPIRNKNKIAVKQSALKFRERGWEVSSPIDIKTYDSFSDIYCPWALAIQYNLHASYRSGELLGNSEITEREANKRATILTNTAIEPLRERFIKDKYTLPTMTKKSTIPRCDKLSHTSKLLLKTSSLLDDRRGVMSSTKNTTTPNIVSLRSSNGRNSKQRPSTTPNMNNNKNMDDSNHNNINRTRNNFGNMTQELKNTTYRPNTTSSSNRDGRLLNISWQESKASSEAEVACLHAVIRRESLLKDLHEAINIPLDFFQTLEKNGNDRNDRNENNTDDRDEDDDDMNSVDQVQQLMGKLNTNQSIPLAPNSVIRGLLSLIRIAGLECVEAIVKWRNLCLYEDCNNIDGDMNGSTTGPGTVNMKSMGSKTFIYHNQNYLLKMVGDLDFISLVPQVEEVILKGQDLINRSNKNQRGSNQRDSIQFNHGKIIIPNGNPFLSNIDILINRSYALENPCSDEEKELSEAENDPLGEGYDILRLREAEGYLLLEVKHASIEAEREAGFYDPLSDDTHHDTLKNNGGVNKNNVNDRNNSKQPDNVMFPGQDNEISILPSLSSDDHGKDRPNTTEDDKNDVDDVLIDGHFNKTTRPMTGDKHHRNNNNNHHHHHSKVFTGKITSSKKLTQSRIAQTKRDAHELSQSIAEGQAELNTYENKFEHLELSINDINNKLKDLTGNINQSGRSSTVKKPLQSNIVSKNIRSLGARKEYFKAKSKETESEIRKLRNALCLDKLELRRLRRLQKSHENKLIDIENKKELKKKIYAQE